MLNNEAKSIISVDGNDAYFEQGRGTLAIYESMDMFFPYATYDGVDSIGFYVQHYPLVQNSNIRVSLMDGDSKIDYKFIPFSEDSVLRNPITHAFDYNLSMLHPNSFKLLMNSEYSSKKCKSSEYVKYIASSCGLKSVVEESDEERIWICPGWRHSQMLRYLSQHSLSTSGSSGYKYFINRNDELVFKTIDKFFDEGGDGEDLEIHAYDDNLLELVLQRNIGSSLFLSSNNLKTNSYNLEVDDFKKEEFDYNKNLKKYGKVRGVAESLKTVGANDYVGISFNGDRKTSAYYKRLYNKVCISSEMSKIVLTLNQGFSKRKLGGIINIKFRSNDNTEISLPYSGRYVIKDLTTILGKSIAQRICLVRPGLNITRDGVV